MEVPENGKKTVYMIVRMKMEPRSEPCCGGAKLNKYRILNIQKNWNMNKGKPNAKWNSKRFIPKVNYIMDQKIIGINEEKSSEMLCNINPLLLWIRLGNFL